MRAAVEETLTATDDSNAAGPAGTGRGGGRRQPGVEAGDEAGHTEGMSHQDVAGDMDAWSSARVRQWMSTLSEDNAPRSVNWWLRMRWIAQLHVYDRTLTAEARREWAEVALSLTDRAERFASYDRWSSCGRIQSA